ncbi:hypothetical protein Tco_0854563 [Tanacetum coccineum]
MTPKKRTTRTSPATTTTTTTPITEDQLKALISQGVDDVLAERDATRSRNGEDSHDSGNKINDECYRTRYRHDYGNVQHFERIECEKVEGKI